MTTKRTLRRHLADARAQIQRLADARDAATEDAGTGGFNTVYLSRQLSDAREENEELRRQLKARPAGPAPAGWERERFQLRRDLALSERARESLDAQVLQLGAVNERLAAEAYDRAEAGR